MVDKLLDPGLVAGSVVNAPTVAERVRPTAHPYVMFVAQAAQTITPWGVNFKQRDRELRNFWHTEPWLASVVYSVSIRNASFAWEIVGADPAKVRPKNTIAKVLQILKNSDRGHGWKSLITKTCIDLYSQDMGAVWEIIRTADDPNAPVVNIAHLDAGQCIRTGDPMYPIIYTDRQNVEHALKYYQVRTLEEFPSPIEEAFGMQYCLLGDSSVRMADGSTRRIRELVKNRSTEYVLSVDDAGNMVPRRIVNWYENPRGDRRLINIRGKRVSSTRGRQNTNSWVTEDHPVLTPTGWMPAGKLVTGDSIVTSAPGLSQDQKELLIGTLMGDGSLSTNGNLPRLSMGHTDVQREWLNIKAAAFESLDVTRWEDTKRKIVHFNTRVQPVLTDYHAAFYAQGKKVFPLDLIKANFSSRLLAAWYMDDGTLGAKKLKKTDGYSYHASIGTGSQPVEVLQELCNFLTGLGYVCHVVSNGYDGQFNLNFTVGGTRKLAADIGMYVVPSLRYKLPVDAPAFNPAVWLINDSSVRFVDEVIVGEKEKKQVATVFCIDVEDTHNFISANVVVHNCAVSRCFLAAEIIQSIAVYKQEKVGGTFTKAIDAVSGITQQNIDDALSMAEEQNLNKGLYRFSLPVIIPGVDPTSTLSHVHIDLASLPDNFSEDDSFKWYVAQLAAAFGVDYQEIAPLMTGNLGSSQQSEIMHLKTRGKGPALIMGLIEDIINNGLVPSNVEFRFLEQDLRSEKEKADARYTRAMDRAMRVKVGELDPQGARKIAVEDGDLPLWLAEEMDRRNPVSTNNEVTPDQILGGVETEQEQETEPIVP